MKQCSIEGCENPSKTRGWCTKHYGRWKAHGNPLTKLTNWREPKTSCTIDGCERTTHTHSYCEMHARRIRMTGDPGPVGRLTAAPGTARRVDSNGYIVVSDYKGRKGGALEHRVVMMEHLGRDLLRHESVHHINGDRSDNRLENLELWSSSQPSGQRIEDKVKWAKEILELYGDMSENSSLRNRTE